MNPLKYCKIVLTRFIPGLPRMDCHLIRRSRKQSYSGLVWGWDARTRSHPCRLLKQLSAYELAWRVVGVTIDSGLTFNEHAVNICKASAYHIRSLRHIRRFIDEDAATSVATALVSARIDYCNSLLYGTSKSITLTNFRDFKTRLLVPRCVLGNSIASLQFWPLYTLAPYQCSYNVQSSTANTQGVDHAATGISVVFDPCKSANQTVTTFNSPGSVQHCMRTAFASRAFCHAAPAVWNELHNLLNCIHSTVSLSEFKRNLK